MDFTLAHHSAPRTPSPNQYQVQHHYDKDMDNNNIFQPSLLQELYEQDIDYNPQHDHPLPTQPLQIYRRATFPYVRHDRDDLHLYPSTQPFLQPQQQPFYQDHFYPQPWQEDIVKHEDHQPQLIVPSQSSQLPFFPHQHALPQQQQPHHQVVSPALAPLSYLPPHSAMPVQHTDDAASKETQYLRRRCFNCHTTEPPSWRRSTLNPGKIVCNKCGLYERTHLRPRPLRFDELRSGNKARKQSNAAATTTAVPGKQSPTGGVSPKVKKEPREFALPRRSSVSSSASSTSGASDWDDNVSVYSAGSAPPTSFNSPAAPSFPLSRDSQSPPRDATLIPSGGIRLPNAPLSDIASFHQFAPNHESPIPSPPLSASLPPTPQILSPSLEQSSGSPLLSSDGIPSAPATPNSTHTTPRKSHSLPITNGYHHHHHHYSPQAQNINLTLSPQSLSLNLGEGVTATSAAAEMGMGLRRMSVSSGSSTLGSVPEESAPVMLNALGVVEETSA